MVKILEKDIKVKNKSEKKKIRLKNISLEMEEIDKKKGGLKGDSSFEINKIYCGDCLEIIEKMPGDLVDIIITSPPYNFGLEYENHTDTKNWDEYFNHLNEVWKQCKRVLKSGGRLCVNIQPLFSDYIPSHHIISKQLLDLGLLFKSEILWEKHNYNCKYTAWGSWQSPSMPYLKYTWEFIEVFCKGSHKKVGDQKKIDILGDEFKNWVYARWSIAPEHRMQEFGHPAMFPEEIPYRLLKLFSYKGDLVLDPFNGCGTTTLVATKLQRNFIGIDISPKYCEIAEKRLKEAQLQLL